MAKVGSTSIYKTLKGIVNPIYHIHSLNEKQFLKDKQTLADKNLFPDSRINFSSIKNHLSNKPTTIITAVRNPIERNISAFFEVIEFYVGSDYETYSQDQLKQKYLDLLPHFYPLQWFDDEILEFTGIDVYNYSFDKEKKYIVIKEGNITLLIFRLDIDQRSLVNLINQSFHVEIEEIKKVNQAAEKHYNKQYDSFKENITFNSAYLGSILTHKFSNHFFTKKELHCIRKRWIDKDE